MSDYIERQKAIQWVKTECNPYGKPTLDFESGKKVIEHLERMPSADVAPVVHSQWIKTEDGAECENCGREAVYQIVDDHWEYEPWCPHCGAKMDGERKE